jgi:S1-C subfamily serine protease
MYNRGTGPSVVIELDARHRATALTIQHRRRQAARDEITVTRGLVAPLVALLGAVLAAQAPGVLHIRATIGDAERQPTPVARHRLLISDNPATSVPREIVTSAEGTAEVKLPPGNYIVESDTPFVFDGYAYTWTQILDIAAGREATLELTAANAEVVTADSLPAGRPPMAPNALGAEILARGQPSLVEIWTPTTRASGFVVGAGGWIATNQRGVEGTTSVEVQLTPALKVPGIVVVAEPGRDVAIIRIAPDVLSPAAPIKLPCAAPLPPLEEGQTVAALGVPLRQAAFAWSARLGRIGPYALETDLDMERGSAGGPAFTADGTLVGLTSVVDGSDERRPDYRIVRVEHVCAALGSAETLASGAAAPPAVHLPVESTRPFPPDALERLAAQYGGTRHPHQASSSGFDVAFITPAAIYAARHRTRPTSLPERTSRTRMPDPEAEQRARGLMDFGQWSDYLADYPPVLLIRVTPRLVEGFWTMVARGAAQTQGVALPPMKRFKAGFARMQAYCGERDVTPIHPFVLERPISESNTIQEGLYVFDPGALNPDCGSVRLVLYSQTSPHRGDTLAVDRKLLQQVWEEFAPHRAAR